MERDVFGYPMKDTLKRSPLKWAGGKSTLLVDILKLLPNSGRKFVEPFAGSAVVSLNILDFKEILINDTNEDLINFYIMLKEFKEHFIKDCRGYFTGDDNNEESFTHLRKVFNSTNDSYEKAILFLYLNRHCFNGLCRYNSKGKFNVPFGRIDSPYFPETELLNTKNKLQKVILSCDDFRVAMNPWNFTEEDVIYCDPPYLPLSDTAKFTDYSPDGFSIKDHEDLAALASTGPHKVVISNHDTPLARELYKAAQIIEIDVNRYISAKGTSRGKVAEILAVF